MSTMSNFTHIKTEYIEEYKTNAMFWEHNITKAKILMLENNDTNKVFGISFRTPVSDSTGVAHILEHSVLAGSKKYPTKEPFVDLLKGSLYTFLNAFTYPDRTCYPVASQNPKDFYNLIDVYLDAVFNPLLTEKTFYQEGWHYEVRDKKDPLEIKGVVYNEMKGVYSNPENILSDEIMYSLFPDMSYCHDSGGNPEAIPTLSYDQFKNFHDTYYHPSNSYIYFYGDDHSESRFEKIQEFLKEFKFKEVKSEIKLQRKLSSIPMKEAFFDEGEDKKGGFVTKNWLIHDYNLLELAVLNDLLFGNSEAYLYKALIESKLGDDVTACGFETFGIQPFFMVGLKGVKEENQDRVINVIDKTLTNIVKNSFDPNRIEATLNSIEFSLRELNTGSYPRGLSMMTTLLQNWIYDKNPLDQIRFERDFEQLRKNIIDENNYLENKLTQYIIDNKHNLIVKLTPKKGLNESHKKIELERLSKLKKSLSDSDLEKMIELTNDLIAHQSKPDSLENKAKIPKLGMEDLISKVEKIPTEINKNDNYELHTHNINTNNISYIKLAFPLANLSEDDYFYLPFIQRALKEFDSKNHTNIELTNILDTHTGNFSTSILNTYTKNKNYKSMFVISTKAMPDKVNILLETIYEIITETIFDNTTKIEQFIKDEISSFKTNILSSGHSIALGHLYSQLSISGKIQDNMYGISQFNFLKKLSESKDKELLKLVTEKLQQIASKIFISNYVYANLTTNNENISKNSTSIINTIKKLPKSQKFSKIKLLEPTPSENIVFVTQSKVNYNCQANITKPEDDNKVNVILKHLNLDYLWNKVRVIGGAYGSKASYSKSTNIFSIMSYRDPRIVGTYNDYSKIIDFLKNDITKEQLHQSIIGAIGEFDSYELPNQKGARVFFDTILGYTYEDNVKEREAILNTSRIDIKEFGNTLEKSTEILKTSVSNATGANEVKFKKINI
jgi:presequence protease